MITFQPGSTLLEGGDGLSQEEIMQESGEYKPEVCGGGVQWGGKTSMLLSIYSGVRDNQAWGEGEVDNKFIFFIYFFLNSFSHLFLLETLAYVLIILCFTLCGCTASIPRRCTPLLRHWVRHAKQLRQL